MRDKLPSIHELCQGRWRSIIKALDIAVPDKPSRHGPCPICGGTTRFRFDDKDGKGTWICNACGAGTGVDLVMGVKKMQFIDAVRLIEEKLPSSVIVMPRRASGVDPEIYRNLWRTAAPLDGRDPASFYLRKRGIVMDVWPKNLRYISRMTYRHPDGTREQHPAMLALYVSPDTAEMTIHATYLDHYGEKARVPEAKKLAPMSVPRGGAVRLAPSAETMGIAEGIETALSAMLMHDIPVWSGLDAGGVMKWEPPATARHIIIFGDNDTSFAGQLAAYSLAHRLRLAREGGIPRFASVEVRIPGFAVEADATDTDWNDWHRLAKEAPNHNA
jgi:putative DNA primase/helicase